MLSPQTWHDYGLSMVAAIPTLKAFFRVKEEEHLYNQLKTNRESPILVFVDLVSNGSAANIDAYKEKNQALVFILDLAITPKEFTPEKELIHDIRTHEIAEKFKYYLMHQQNGASNYCSFLRFLDVNSIHQEPVYNFHGYNGYSLDFNF